MSHVLPGMLDDTMAKIREMVNVNTVVGDPINVAEDLTIIPISKVSVAFGGGGSDYVSKHPNSHENPFGGGVCTGVKVTPTAFLVVKEGGVRILPVAEPANTTVDRLVEMLPDALDKIVSFIDAQIPKKAE